MLTAARVLAENNFGDTRSGSLAGPMGLLMIVLLAIATVLLIRNMNARLRRLPDRFPIEGEGSGPAEGESTDSGEHVSSDLVTPGSASGDESIGSVPRDPKQDRKPSATS